MSNVFKLLCGRSGLSLRDAEEYLGVSRDTVLSWSCGRNQCPEKQVNKLRALCRIIDDVAERSANIVQRRAATHPSPSGYIDLPLSMTDEAARRIGLPCIGAHAAVLGAIASMIDIPVRIIPGDDRDAW